MTKTTVKTDYKNRKKENILTKGEAVTVHSIDGNMATVTKPTDPNRREIIVPVSYLDL